MDKKMDFTVKLLDVQNDLDAGLKRGHDFAELFRTLITTQNHQDLLEAADQLYDYVVDSEAVVFPRKFSASDYYLIFMTRLLELNQIQANFRLETRPENGYQILKQVWNEEERASRFESRAGKVAYVDLDSKSTIFNLDLNQKRMSFETDTINSFYFVNNQSDTVDKMKLFTNFGQLLEKNYDFDVDFNMFDARNKKIYELEQQGLNTEIIDELFIEAAKNNRTLLNIDQKLGGILKLDNGIEFSILQINQKTDQWAIRIGDDNEKYALFDIFKEYDFLNDWYVRNITELKLKMLF